MSTKFLKNPFVFIPVVLGILLPCIVFLFVHFSRAANSQSKLVLKDAVVISGQPLPVTELLDLNGKSLSPEILRRGKVLLIFLMTDCRPCQQEWKLLAGVDSEISDRVTIYGVGVENSDRILNYIHANELKTKILLDKDGALMDSLSVRYFPTKFLVQDGVIVKTWFGNSPDKAALFRELGF